MYLILISWTIPAFSNGLGVKSLSMSGILTLMKKNPYSRVELKSLGYINEQILGWVAEAAAKGCPAQAEAAQAEAA